MGSSSIDSPSVIAKARKHFEEDKRNGKIQKESDKMLGFIPMSSNHYAYHIGDSAETLKGIKQKFNLPDGVFGKDGQVYGMPGDRDRIKLSNYTIDIDESIMNKSLHLNK